MGDPRPHATRHPPPRRHTRTEMAPGFPLSTSWAHRRSTRTHTRHRRRWVPCLQYLPPTRASVASNPSSHHPLLLTIRANGRRRRPLPRRWAVSRKTSSPAPIQPGSSAAGHNHPRRRRRRRHSIIPNSIPIISTSMAARGMATSEEAVGVATVVVVGDAMFGLPRTWFR